MASKHGEGKVQEDCVHRSPPSGTSLVSSDVGGARVDVKNDE